jgi:hypothetical protein
MIAACRGLCIGDKTDMGFGQKAESVQAGSGRDQAIAVTVRHGQCRSPSPPRRTPGTRCSWGSSVILCR